MDNRTIDQLLPMLLKMEEDQYLDVKKNLWPTRCPTQKKQGASHQCGMFISDEHITKVIDIHSQLTVRCITCVNMHNTALKKINIVLGNITANRNIHFLT